MHAVVWTCFKHFGTVGINFQMPSFYWLSIWAPTISWNDLLCINTGACVNLVLLIYLRLLFVCLHATSDSSTATSASTTEAELTSNGGQNTAGSDVASASDCASLRVDHRTCDVNTPTTDDYEEVTSGSECYVSCLETAVAPSTVEGPAVELQELNSSNNEL